jgi:hypothetical protein
MKAREVLNDCKLSCWELKNALEENNHSLIRVRWITCLTLLRIVGHVLHKVDQPNYPNNQKEFSDIYSCKKDESIFKDFIEHERNNALKSYQVDLTESENSVEVEIGLLLEDGGRFLTESGDRIILEGTEKVIYFAKKTNNLVDEERPDYWIEKAIEWWEIYLTELNDKINVT